MFKQTDLILYFICDHNVDIVWKQETPVKNGWEDLSLLSFESGIKIVISIWISNIQASVFFIYQSKLRRHWTEFWRRRGIDKNSLQYKAKVFDEILHCTTHYVSLLENLKKVFKTFATHENESRQKLGEETLRMKNHKIERVAKPLSTFLFVSAKFSEIDIKSLVFIYIEDLFVQI